MTDRLIRDTPATVLVAEDDAIDRGIIRRIFEARGVIVAEAHSAADAIEHLETSAREHDSVDLVILDWKLTGGQTGTEVLGEIRSSRAFENTPVVVVSKSKAPVDVRAAYRAGASGFVAKSHDLATYERAVESICIYWLEIVEVPPPSRETN